MTIYESKILKHGYNHYIDKQDNMCSYLAVKSEDLLPVRNALTSLVSSGYIEMLSDNLNDHSYDLAPSTPNFHFKLTLKGIEHCRTKTL